MSTSQKRASELTAQDWVESRWVEATMPDDPEPVYVRGLPKPGGGGVTRQGDFVTTGFKASIGNAEHAARYFAMLRAVDGDDPQSFESELFRFLRLAAEKGGFVEVRVGYVDPEEGAL